MRFIPSTRATFTAFSSLIGLYQPSFPRQYPSTRLYFAAFTPVLFQDLHLDWKMRASIQPRQRQTSFLSSQLLPIIVTQFFSSEG
jgi:hypothetical protein